MTRDEVVEAMARICCCNGKILDKRRPFETMVCCRQYVVEPALAAVRAAAVEVE